MNNINNDLKGLCLFLGMLSLGYLALILAVALFTGAKIYKGTLLIAMAAAALITFGLNSQVKTRLYDYSRAFFVRTH